MRIALSLALAVTFFAPSAASADQKSELAKLKGTYKTVSVKRGGMDAPAKVLKSKLQIEGDQFTIITKKDDGTERKSAITATIDDSKSPKNVDLGKDGKTRYEGIYKLDGKKLTLCYDRAGTGRPAKFESPAGSRTMLMVFEKEK